MLTTRRDFLAVSAGAAALSATGLSADEQSQPVGKTPHTQFAVNVEMWWTKLPFLDRIRKTAELGFPAIEFWPLKGKDIDAVAALTQELGVEVAQ